MTAPLVRCCVHAVTRNLSCAASFALVLERADSRLRRSRKTVDRRCVALSLDEHGWRHGMTPQGRATMGSGARNEICSPRRRLRRPQGGVATEDIARVAARDVSVDGTVDGRQGDIAGATTAVKQVADGRGGHRRDVCRKKTPDDHKRCLPWTPTVDARRGRPQGTLSRDIGVGRGGMPPPSLTPSRDVFVDETSRATARDAVLDRAA